MSKIISVKAREIIDSRGNPTVEVTCNLENSVMPIQAVASVPSGASTGIHEALELRDLDKKRYNGLGVKKAVANVNTKINDLIKGKDFDQNELDKAMIDSDGTENKSRLGANAILGVSLAFARASAIDQGVPLYEYLGNLVGNTTYSLPLPMFNIINGGKHADSGLDIQEFMIGPVGPKIIKEKVRAAAEIIVALKKILKAKGYSVGIGDEGGFAPQLRSNEEAFDVIVKAIEVAGYTTKQIKIGIDAAASSFFDKGAYRLRIGGKAKKMNSLEIVGWYEQLALEYPIISIEDGLHEEDWAGFALLTKKIGKKVKVVGDDLLVTNVARIRQSIKEKATNSVLIKPNQIGSLSETIDAIQLAKKEGWAPFMSHRSGETTDTFIADLAVGLSCDFIKTGSLVRGERVCKYNRLMEIEDALGY